MGCANNKSTISINLGTALTKVLPQSSGVWLHCHCNTFFLKHPVVDSILSKWSWSCCMTQFHPCFSLCFVSTILWYTEEPHVLWLYNAQVLLLPKPEVNDILRLRFVICGTMHPLWFRISESESVPEILWFYQIYINIYIYIYQLLKGLEWDKKKRLVLAFLVQGTNHDWSKHCR